MKWLRNVIAVVVVTVGLLLWQIYMERQDWAGVLSWTYWAGVPVAIGCIGVFWMKGAFWQRLSLALLSLALFGAYFLPDAMSSPDSEALGLLIVIVGYLALATAVCMLALESVVRWRRSKGHVQG